jgi:hypothetical protein
MRINHWVFVTGAPRSGTTFVGKMLSIPREVDYFHEPFNPSCGVRGIDQLYLYIARGDDESLKHRQAIERVFRKGYVPKISYSSEDPLWRNWTKRLLGSRRAWSHRIKKLNPSYRTVVIKDPTGCLLTEYLAEKYDVKPVILIRHPVAVVASFLRLGWQGDLAAICQQPQLIEDYFFDDQHLLFEQQREPLERIAVLWRALNKVLLAQASRHPSWRIVTHESLSEKPIEKFRQLYDALDLPMSARAEKKISRLTSKENAVEARIGQVHEFKRNSAELFRNSLKAMSLEQRRKIFSITKDVALRIYSKESFRLDNEVTGHEI